MRRAPEIELDIDFYLFFPGFFFFSGWILSTLIANNSQTVSENIGFLYLRVSNKELFLFFSP